MRKAIIQQLLKNKTTHTTKQHAFAFAPSNIALIKYWGKRNSELNLPTNSSLSISLGDKGASVKVKIHPSAHQISINQRAVNFDQHYGQQLLDYVNDFSLPLFLAFDIHINLPIAAGLASSACLYAAMVMAINDLFAWQLPQQTLSILARLGSGSACRSIADGFVEWQMGQRDDGMDSYATPLHTQWPSLCVGLCVVDAQMKKTASRQGMQHTMATSPLYAQWPIQAARDLVTLKNAIDKKDFTLLGNTAEKNACFMHKTMAASQPTLNYSLAATHALIQQVRDLRQQGVAVYFTQDAGPNLKLLFLQENISIIQTHFKNIDIIQPMQLKEQVILVDENDHALGITDKLSAHRQGQLHRAFSVFVFRHHQGALQVLLQQRHPDKYHSGGLWTNTCCSHPRPNETVIAAGERRVQEEMGLTVKLQKAGEFCYRAELDNQLIEHEYDHVLIGYSEQDPIDYNPLEVMNTRWIAVDALQQRLVDEPRLFTAWFADSLKIALEGVSVNKLH